MMTASVRNRERPNGGGPTTAWPDEPRHCVVVVIGVGVFLGMTLSQVAGLLVAGWALHQAAETGEQAKLERLRQFPEHLRLPPAQLPVVTRARARAPDGWRPLAKPGGSASIEWVQ